MTHTMRNLTRYRRARLIGASSAAAIVWSLASAAQAQDLPTNPVIVDSNGVGTAADFTFGANTLVVDQHHDRVVIDWDDFNIGAADTVTFNQLDANSIAFNRVDPSQLTTIDGALNSNGGVWLFSPGGLLFGASATVNVGSFVGSTATLQNADIADALATNSVTLAGGTATTLTVTAGADITATSGFVVLLGETIVQNGTVVSDLDAVWYGVARGGELTFTPGAPGSGPNLDDATVAGVAGQQPAFTQGSAGVTTAGTWVGVSTPSTVNTGWSTLINLGGAINASGAQPGGPGVVIITGDDGAMDLTTAPVEVDASGATITSTEDVYIAATTITTGDIDGDRFVITNSSGATTIEGDITSVEGTYVFGDGGVTIAATGSIDSDYSVMLFTDAAGADIDIQGGVYADYSVIIVADDQLTIAGNVHGLYGVYAYGLDVNISGMVTGTYDPGGVGNYSVELVAGDDLTLTSTSDITGETVVIRGETAGSVIDLSGDIYGYEVSVTTDGDINQLAGTITVDDGGLYFYALDDITTEAGALIETSPDGGMGIIYLNAGHDLYLDGDIHGGYFVTINSVGIGNDTTLEVGGSIYSTDFIILYNDYGDIHLTSTAELYAGSPIAFSEPGIFIAAEGSILTDAGSYIHTMPGYADGYVHFEVNDVTGSIDLSSDITSENITIEAPFGVVDIYLRAGTIQTANDFYVDSNGVLLVGAAIYADYVTLEAVGDLTVSGVIGANSGVSLTSTGGDVYIDGFIEAFASSGTAILVSAEGDLTIAGGGDLEGYGDVVLQTTGPTGVLEVSGDVLGYNVYIVAEGGILVGSTADIYAYGYLSLLSDGPGATAADIQIDGEMDGNGVSIINRNDGDVIFGATADVASYYYACTFCRTDPGGETGLLGQDGDIYIYSAGSVITVAGSIIDATQGSGADAGLVTIVANGTDGPSATPAAIDLSGDINAYNVVLTTTNGSIRQREGTISFTESFTADADLSFIQDGGGVIDGLNGIDHGSVDVDANNNILLLGDILGYYVDLTTTGSVAGSDIQIAGDLYASDGITVTNLNGDILVHDSGVVHTGTPYETSSPDIVLSANGVITTEAGSQIYTDPAYGAGSQITIRSSIASGLGIDLAGDISTAGDVAIYTSVGGDVRITGGDIEGDTVSVTSEDEIDITGGQITAVDTAYFYSNADMLLGGDVNADYIVASLYLGESGGIYGSVLRVEGQLIADTDLSLYNSLGAVEIGSTAVVIGNFSGLADTGYVAVSIDGDTILTEAGSLITVGTGGNPVGRIALSAYGDPSGGPAVDLSGDIIGDVLTIDAGTGSIRQRDGTIDVIADLYLNVDGYFITDDPADIHTDGDFTALSYGGMTVEGDITADRILLVDDSANDLVIGGTLTAEEDITVHSLQDDLRLDGATLIADSNNSTSGQDYNGVYLSADGQVTSTTTSSIRVGPAGAPTGDVHIAAHGLDGGGFSSIDLSGDIEAEHLYLYTQAGSIRLRDGDIVLEEDLYIDSPRGFLMNAPATITTDGYVEIRAVDGVSVIGTITSGEYIRLSATGLTGGGVTVNGYLYADGDIDISSVDPSADIVLGGPTIIADADNNGSGDVTIDSAGAVVAPGDGLIQVGDGSGAPTGDVTIHAAGVDGSTTSAIDLSIDITAVTLTLDADAGSIHIGGSANFLLTDDFTVDSVLDFDMDDGATVYSDGDIDITAHGDLIMDGLLDSAGDVRLTRAGPGGGDLSIGGSIVADQYVGIISDVGDITIDDASIVADADGMGGDGELVIRAQDGQVIAENGGSLAVGIDGVAATGDITISGWDGVETNLDTYSINLDLFSTGSVHVAGGELFATGDVYVGAFNDVAIDAAAAIEAGGDVDVIAGVTMSVGADITADGDILLLLDGDFFTGFTPGPGDMVVSGDLTANGSVTIENAEGGDIYIDGSAAILADADTAGTGEEVYITADGQVISAAGSTIAIGGPGAPTGDVTILADGTDNANYSAIDLSGDIEAQVLTLETTNGSIALDDGTFNATLGVQIDSDGAFTLEDGAVVTTGGNFIANAQGAMTIDGYIDAGYNILITRGGAANADITISGDLYAAANIDISQNGAAGDVILNGAHLLADTDVFGSGSVQIVSNGQVYAYNGGLISAGTVASPTNLVSITAFGLDGGGLSAVDLDIDINAATLIIDAPDGSIHLAGGAITVLNDLSIISQIDLIMDAPASIVGGGDVYMAAGNNLFANGDITAADDVYLILNTNAGQGDFTAGPGDLVVGGAVTADGSVIIDNAEGADIYLAGTASIVADADNSASGDYVYITADGQVISAGGSSIRVGASGAPTGDVTILAGGADNANYSAIDLSSDIEAVNLTIDANAGSVNIAGGAIDVSGDVYVEADLDVFMDEPANIVAGGDVYMTGARTFIVDGGIDAGGDITLLLEGPNAQDMTIDRLLTAGGDIDIRNTGSGLLSFGPDTGLNAGEDIFIQANGALSMEGQFNAQGYVYAQTDNKLDLDGGIQAGTDVTLISGGGMVLQGDIGAQSGSVIADSGQSLYQDGQVIAGENIALTSSGDMTVNGDLTAAVDINLYVYGGESGGDIEIGGDLIAHDDITIYNTADYGDVHLLGTGSLTADVDGNGGQNVDILIYAGGRIVTDAGSTMHVGSPTLRTGFISMHAYGYDGEGGWTIDLSGDIDAESVTIEAANGSVRVRDGSIQADEDIEIYAYEYFQIDAGALIWGAQERTFQNDVSTETTLPGAPPGVFIAASDVSISGDIQSGDAEDDATIVIQALNVSGDVTVGGADTGLGTGFTLSDAEFQNLIADRIVILAGPGGDGYDLHLADLSIDAANTSDVWFGTSGTVFVEGDLAPTQPGAVDLHIGFTVLTQSAPHAPTALDPGQMLVDFIPGDIYISGSLGNVSNPFGQVTLVAQGDILMGSQAFIDAAEADPEFSAAEESENFESPGEDHIFIAADILQMAALGAILQQDTTTGPGYGGLALGLPQEGLELIFSPDDIQGDPIGGPSGWIADFNAGPERVELFGFFSGTPHAITGRDAALVDHLLDPDILLGDYFFNTCLFGNSAECSGGEVVPPFQNPTPPVHPEPGVDPGVDEVLTFFTSFPFSEPEDEEDEDEVEGEPVTGSGNEDLWPIRREGGRP